MARLFEVHGIDFSKQFVSSVGAAEWDDDSLGCPESATYYDNRHPPYPGLFYLLSDGEKFWEYHSNADDSVVIRCSEITPVAGETTNITKEAKLRDSKGVTLLRKKFSSGKFEVQKALTPEDHDYLVNIFDIETDLSIATNCNTIFKLEFDAPGRTNEIEFICEKNYKAFDLFWNGLQAKAPVVGKIIGPYLTGNPIPTLPKASP
tara:strand:- start:3442 stop:4056 length:615 start_codon:yes stop_codon:yes gene_type:complete